MDAIDKAGGATDVPRLRPSSVQPAAAPPTAPVRTGAGADTEMSDLLAALADTAPPVDTKKVDAIRSLIQAGAYPIDPQKIAAKMVALDFPGHGGGADA